MTTTMPLEMTQKENTVSYFPVHPFKYRLDKNGEQDTDHGANEKCCPVDLAKIHGYVTVKSNY